jgi:hypothetical protein
MKEKQALAAQMAEMRAANASETAALAGDKEALQTMLAEADARWVSKQEAMAELEKQQKLEAGQLKLELAETKKIMEQMQMQMQQKEEGEEGGASTRKLKKQRKK